MLTLQFDAQLIRAAMACQGKRDKRYYLNGILVATNGDVVGTDGHVLFRGQHSCTVPRDVILNIDGTIPAGATTVTVELPDAEPGTAGTVRTDNDKLFHCSIVDGRYPDYPRVIPPRVPSDGQFSNVLPFNAGTLARIADTFGKKANVAVYHSRTLSSIRVEDPARPDWVMVAMPVRLDVPDTLSLRMAG